MGYASCLPIKFKLRHHRSCDGIGSYAHRPTYAEKGPASGPQKSKRTAHKFVRLKPCKYLPFCAWPPHLYVMRIPQTKRVALYLRVSTDDQSVEAQRNALQGVAKRHGWRVVAEFVDAGISGTKSRDKRPGFDAMLKAVTRREIDVVAAFSVDRLGRSLQDLVSFLSELQASGAGLYLYVQALDTTTPSGKAMFQMLGVFAEFERSMIVARVHAGLDRARKQGKRLGRPKIDPAVERKIKAALTKGEEGILKIAARHAVGSGTVQRIKAAMAT